MLRYFPSLSLPEPRAQSSSIIVGERGERERERGRRREREAIEARVWSERVGVRESRAQSPEPRAQEPREPRSPERDRASERVTVRE